MLTAERGFQDLHLSAVHSTSTWGICDAGAGKYPLQLALLGKQQVWTTAGRPAHQGATLDNAQSNNASQKGVAPYSEENASQKDQASNECKREETNATWTSL